MSRKIVDGNCVVRLDTKTPSPYLVKHWRQLLPLYPSEIDFSENLIIDVGCGNLRNTNWLRDKWAQTIYSIDRNPIGMDAKYIWKCDVGKDSLPIDQDEVGQVDVFLVNYVFMFLDKKGRKHLISEIKRVASPHARIMVELYKAVDGYAKTDEAIKEMQQEIFDELGWTKIHWSKGKFIAGSQ